MCECAELARGNVVRYSTVRLHSTPDAGRSCFLMPPALDIPSFDCQEDDVESIHLSSPCLKTERLQNGGKMEVDELQRHILAKEQQLSTPIPITSRSKRQEASLFGASPPEASSVSSRGL